MRHRPTPGATPLLALAFLVPLACAGGEIVGGRDWPSYAADKGSSKYSPLTQIDAANVDQLQLAWRWSSVDNEIEERLASARLGQSWFEATPLAVDGQLFVRTSYSVVVALDGATGATLWSYDPKATEAGRPTQFGFVSRGLAYWRDGEDERLISTTGDGRLLAIDASSGRPVPSFGDGGEVDLSIGLEGPFNPRLFNFGSPPTVCRDVIVVGSSITDGPTRKEMPRGDVRGFDVRTGELRWVFHTVPQQGELGQQTWEEGSWQYSGNTNVWSMTSADETLGYVYLPVGTPTNDWYGGHRLGDNLFAESLVCLECETGRRVWHFQTVHHGLWDYDLPAAPNLVDIEVDGRPISAVAQISKQAFTYVFDRRTGEPVWPIEEREVPASNVPGERTSPTQPFPAKPPPFDRQGVTHDDLIDFTPELRERAIEILEPFDYGPIFTPPSLRGTVNMPGWSGGGTWSGAAFDPETAVLYVASTTYPIVVRLDKPDPARSNFNYIRSTPREIHGPDGLPLFKPPYSRITAIDLNRGEHLWTAAVGDGPREHPLLKDLDLPPLGSGGRVFPLLTKTLLFVGTDWSSGGRLAARRTQRLRQADRKLRAFTKSSGELLWEMELPASPNGAPMTYLADGKQYLVVAVGGRDEPSELVALSLP